MRLHPRTRIDSMIFYIIYKKKKISVLFIWNQFIFRKKKKKKRNVAIDIVTSIQNNGEHSSKLGKQSNLKLDYFENYQWLVA